MTEKLDPQTKRPFGDHGPAHLALNYALDEVFDPYDQIAFLDNWREGAAYDEWPEFYTWLKKQERGAS